MPNAGKCKWLLQMKGLQIQKLIIKELLNSVLVGYEELCGLGLFYLLQPSASADNTNLCLDNSSFPTRPHSIIT